MFKRLLMTTPTFYRRELPENLHAFTSETGKRLFKTSLADGNANIFFALSGNFTMQSEPAFCGLGSLAMVLNALSVDPGKRWKGIWRWYSDDMIECCAPLDVIKEKGMTFDQLAATARGNGLIVVPKRADFTTFDEFLEDLKMVTKSDDKHMVVSFSRQSLGQTGDGHFSPIGAFCESESQVLVMDTARFKYPSYFVDARALYDSMFALDKSTNRPRGYLLLSKGNLKSLTLCKIQAPKLDWEFIITLFDKELPPKLQNVNDLATIVKVILESIPHKYHFFTKIDANGIDLAGNDQSTTELSLALGEEVKKLEVQVSRHPLFQHVVPLKLNCTRCENEIKIDSSNSLAVVAVMFLLSIPRELMAKFPPNVCKMLFSMRDPIAMKNLPLLNEEVERMTVQWASLLSSYCTCGIEKCPKVLINPVSN